MHQMPKLKRFLVSVPEDLHRGFKLKCVAEGTLMSDAIRRMLQREIGGTANVAAPKTAKPTPAAQRATAEPKSKPAKSTKTKAEEAVA